MGTPPRVDWPQIKEKWPDNERCVAILERRAIHIILSLFARFEWLATFGHSETATTDWDYIQDIMADAEYELGIAMPLSELIPYVDEIEDLLRALNNQANCCDAPDPSNGDLYTDGVEDGVGSVPQNIIDAGYATGASDWEGFADYKCMISHLMVQNMARQIEQFIPFFDDALVIVGGLATIAAVISTIATAGLTVLAVEIIGAVGLVAGLYKWLGTLASGDLQDLADKIIENELELACSIYAADGSSDAVDQLKATIDDIFTVAEATGLKLMNLDAQLKALYAGRYNQQDIAEKMADNGLDPGDYTCGCEATEEDLDIYGLRWDWNLYVTQDESYVYVELPWDSQSINTGAPQTVDPVKTGSQEWLKIVFGQVGKVSVSHGDQVYYASDQYWDETDRWLWWRFRLTVAQSTTTHGTCKNFQALVSDGEGGYVWRDANIHGESIGTYLSVADNEVHVDHVGTGYINSQVQIHVDGVMVPPF